MATQKPSKPNVTLPNNFGGVKTPYTQAQIDNGYQEAVPQVVDGGNVNYEKDGIFQKLKYAESIADVINGTPVKKVVEVDANNNFDYSRIGVYAYETTRTFSKDEISVSVESDGQVALYRSLANNNKGNSLKNENFWKQISLGGGGLEIGDISFAPLGIDEAQNKRRYLNGQVISQTQFAAFADKVKKAVALYPNLATSETNWQAEVTNSKLGQCGKFVIDDELGTIRLPKVVNINGLQDLSLLGGIKAESLPNITDKLEKPTGGVITNSDVSGSGAFFTTKTSDFGISDSAKYGESLKVSFDASRSSSTYKDNAPVQQEAVQYPYFIQVATGTEESVDATSEIELNNPFSLLDYKWSEYEITNASWLISNGAFYSGATYPAVYELLLKIHNSTETKDGVSVKMSTESYTDTDFVINISDTTFRLPIKVKLASGNAVAGNGMTLGWTDGTRLAGTGSSSNDSSVRAYIGNYGVSVGGFTNRGDLAHTTIIGITTDPTKSGIETSSSGLKLYFYVGETIQGANVIAASQVLTRVVNGICKTVKGDRETVVSWGMPDYTAGISKTPNVEFIAEFAGWIYAYTDAGSSGNATVNVYINDELISETNYRAQAHVLATFAKGDRVKAEVYYKNGVIVYPCKGVN